jgi:hypothetical protein
VKDTVSNSLNNISRIRRREKRRGEERKREERREESGGNEMKGEKKDRYLKR